MKHILSVITTIKWRQCPDMTFAVEWDVKHQFKQTNKSSQVDKAYIHVLIYRTIFHYFCIFRLPWKPMRELESMMKS